MSIDMDTDARVTAQAAKWFGALLEGNVRSPEFFAWLEESPRHVEELLFVMADAQDLALLTDEQRERIEELSLKLSPEMQTVPGGSNVIPVFSAASAPRADPPITPVASQGRERDHEVREERTDSSGARFSAPRWAVGLAAAVLLSVAAAWLWSYGDHWRTYSTSVGEQRTITLGDGSVVHLNTDSQVEVKLADTSRSVRLTSGEAMFTVQHDASRPFLVYTSNAVIQAIGTQFVVRRQAGATRVAVIEGLVQVSADRSVPDSSREGSKLPEPSVEPAGAVPRFHFVAAGEATEVPTVGGVSEPQRVDTDRATAWRQRRLVFEEDSLATIASEFNRYNAKIRIRAEGAAAEELFSGTFDADDPEAVVQALASDPTLLVARSGKEIVIRKR